MKNNPNDYHIEFVLNLRRNKRYKPNKKKKRALVEKSITLDLKNRSIRFFEDKDKSYSLEFNKNGDLTLRFKGCDVGEEFPRNPCVLFPTYFSKPKLEERIIYTLLYANYISNHRD